VQLGSDQGSTWHTTAMQSTLKVACGSMERSLLHTTTMLRSTTLSSVLMTIFLGSAGCGTSGGGAGGGGGGGGEGPGAQPTDLYACDIPLACGQVTTQLGQTGPADALHCMARLVASGEPGLLRSSINVGPNNDSTDSWIYVIGDGTAIVQVRERTFCSADTCETETLEEHVRCDLVGHATLVANCDPLDEADPDCTWLGYENCQVIDEQSCESVLAFEPQGGE
jgi:hypothetical protein